MRSKLFVLLVVLAFGVTVPVFAQVALRTGSIYGKTVDDKGGGLPGVTITLESNVGPAQTTTTGTNGAFRFAALDPGVYSALFSLDGFTEIRQEDIRVNVGAQVQLTITMRPIMGEELVVIAETPLVDTKQVGVGSTFNREQLQDVPNGRDPWVIIEQTPGVTTDRYNVGGTQSGQQSEFTARGGSALTTTWSYDGVDYTDPYALGGSTYVDFNSFEEVQINSSANDVSILNGGVAINIVTRRGGTKWEGNGSFYFVNDSLQSDNTPDEAISQGIRRTDQIDEIKDYGFDIGGPVIRDKLFVWGGLQKSEIGIFKADGQSLDFTELKNKNFKAHVNPTSAHESYFQYTSNDKIKLGRIETPDRGTDGTLLDQGGPTNILDGLWAAGHTWTPNGNTIVSGRYSYWGLGFSLNARGGTNVPIVYLAAIPYWQSTYLTQAPIDRPTHNLIVETNHFAEDVLGGDHEFHVGFNYKTARANTEIKFGNGLYVYDTAQTTPGANPVSGFVQVLLPLISNVRYNTTSFYASDTFRTGKLTLNAGVRYDHITGDMLEALVSPPPGFESVIPTIDFKGGDVPVTLENFSPRFGLTYDVRGDGKMIARGGYARYYNGYNPLWLTFADPTAVFGGAFAYFADNGDGNITAGDLTSPLLYFGGLSNYTGGAFDPTAINQIRRFDPDFTAPKTDEFTVGFEGEVMQDFSIGAAWTYRKYSDNETGLGTANAIGSQVGVSSSDFTPCGTYSANTSVGDFSVPLFCFTGTDTGVLELTNAEDFSQTYNGLDLTMKKRMSNNLMLNATFLFQDQSNHYDGGDSLAYTYAGLHNIPFDPTGQEFLDGQPYAYRSGRSGKTGIFQFAEWQLKVGGVYQFPADFSVGTFVRYQQGYPFPLVGSITDSSFPLTYGATTRFFPVEAFGSRRYDDLFTMDVKIQKIFDFNQYGRLAAQVDLFNLFNTNTILQRANDTSTTSLNRIREVFSPRAVRLGVRFSY